MPGHVQPAAPGRSAQADAPGVSWPAGPPIALGNGLGEEAKLGCESTLIPCAIGYREMGKIGMSGRTWRIDFVGSSFVGKGICLNFATHEVLRSFGCGTGKVRR